MKKLLCFICCLTFGGGWAQKPVAAAQPPVDFESVDSLYREDQFYLRFTYNSMLHTPSGYSDARFSPGFGMGFLRDFPFNKARTWAIAPGLGYSFDSYGNNLVVQGTYEQPTWSTKPSNSLSKNKYLIHQLELPIELRWRTSTPESHQFWRVYAGCKLGYRWYQEYVYAASDDAFVRTQIPNLNRWSLSTYLAAGWNTWNIYAGYDWLPFFEGASINGTDLHAKAFQVGLMFYIL